MAKLDSPMTGSVMHFQYRNQFCGCPVGETITSEPQFHRGICCPLFVCEPIACTFGGVDYVEGATVPTIDPCEISWSVIPLTHLSSVHPNMVVLPYGA